MTTQLTLKAQGNISGTTDRIYSGTQLPPVHRQRGESLGPRAVERGIHHPEGLNPTNYQPPLDVQTSNLINNLNRWHLQD